MGYHPETLVCSFPPYVSRAKPWSLASAFYALKPWIGFDVWHIDPEKPNTGNRQDDSCGWFDRTPGSYQVAFDRFLADKGDMQDIENALAVKVFWRGAYSQGWDRMTPADTLAAVSMVAMFLERYRLIEARNRAPGWMRPLVRERRAEALLLAQNLALNPTDNLASCEDARGLVRSVAAALNRHFRPWWRHPRWHVHHWRVNFDLPRNLRRMFEPCSTCSKPLGFGYCPTVDGRGPHHSECLGIRAAMNPEAAQ